MIAFLLWFVAIEVVGLAALPLTIALLPRLPDRGYGVAKVLGLLLLTYLNFLLGSLLGLGNSGALLALGLIALCGGGLFVLGNERATLLAWVREQRTTLLVEEAIFLIIFIAWTLFRANHPGVFSTEKPMDLAMITASHRATSFPPYDPWLAGQNINYYYGGYLAVATMITLTGVAPTIGYNLAVALLCALVGSAAYGVALSLTRNWRWSILGPLFVLVIGNLDGLRQMFSASSGAFNFFSSSRIVEPLSCYKKTSYCTITEFPAFSFLLGDLHPHVVTLAFTILTIGLAVHLALAPAAGWTALAADRTRRVLSLLLVSIAIGALYFMNSWDWPTYLLLSAVALFVPGLRTLERRPLWEAAGLAVAISALSYLLYLPFRLSFAPQYSSFGLKAHGSPTGEVLIMFGLFLLPIAAFLIARLTPDLVIAAAPARPPLAGAANTPVAPLRASAPGGRTGGAAVLERGGGESAVEDDLDDLGLPRLPLPSLRRRRSTPPPPPPERATHIDNDGVAEGEGGSESDDPGYDLPPLPSLSLPSLTSWPGISLVLLAAALVLRLLFGVAGGLNTVGFLLPFALVALYLAWQAGRAGETGQATALLLCAGGIALIMVCDNLYLKDNFCGALDSGGNCTGDTYRMNTVFKFYYQAWTLLALGGAYGVYYLSTRLRIDWQGYLAPGLAVALVLGGGVYTWNSVTTTTTDAYTAPVAHAVTLNSLDLLPGYSGLPISITNAIPNDAPAIRWLIDHTSGHPTLLEADQVGTVPQDYWPFPGAADQEVVMSRISTFTGLPAVLGSGYSHEGLWHGYTVTGQHYQDVHTMYTSPNTALVGSLLRTYRVAYIYVGQVEAYTYYNGDPKLLQAALTRFESFGSVVYNRGGVTIVRTSASTAA